MQTHRLGTFLLMFCVISVEKFTFLNYYYYERM